MGMLGRGKNLHEGVVAVTDSEGHIGGDTFSVRWEGSVGEAGCWRRRLWAECKGSPSQAEWKRETSPWGMIVDVVEYD